MLAPAPLAVILVAHPSFAARGTVLEDLFRRLYRNPDSLFAPSSAVPVVAGTLEADGRISSAPVRADRTAVLLLLDDAGVNDGAFLDAIDRLVAGGDTMSMRVFIVPLATSATRLRRAFALTNYLRVHGEPDASWAQIGSGLVHELCRWLQNRPRWSDGAAGRGSEAPLTIFLSHAKSDGTEIAAKFHAYLQMQTQLKTFFDARDIGPGFPFPEEIKEAVEHCVLLVIRTDAYGTREWCMREVLFAKRAGRPIVVADAFLSREHRSFPYLGNVPAVRYDLGDRDGHERILDALLDETLRQLHFERRAERLLARRRRKKPLVLGSSPELVQFALRRAREAERGAKRFTGKRHVVYPDPPLSAPELALLQYDAERIHAQSLTEFVVGDLGSLRGRCVALSTSEPGDETEHGLSPLHQRDLVVELSRHLFALGVSIAYGGDLRELGFTDLLVEVLRSRMAFSSPVPPMIRSYVTDSVLASERAPYADAVEFVVADTAAAVGDTAQRTALALRVMRRRVAAESHALVAIGGRTAGFSGWRPGVAEEIAAATDAGLPVFLLGGFGGVVRQYAGAVLSRRGLPVTAAKAELGHEPTGELALPTPDGVIQRLRDIGLRNGLRRTDNLRLAESVDADEIVALVLRGLGRALRRAAG